uniref:Putative ATPase involved in DNA repair n=1 Tax=Chlorobium chlorochromatii (strain CaD3) TaxID=340177 RepID=Q3AQ59_CHLCH
MTTYNRFSRGSEWRIWDLHIHTPGTKKNDQFTGATLDEKWQNYVASINSSTEEISVIGITDYFSIENYFKFKHLVANGEITKNFDLIIPNLELRVLPVTGSSTPINLHCLFNPSIDSEIESRFLAKLQFNNSGSNYSATKSELIRFGRDHLNNQGLDQESAYKKGVEQFVVSLDALGLIFKNDPTLRENTIVVVSNRSTDGVTGAIKHEDFFINKGESQLDATRRSLYQFSDAIFSSNDKDRLYFLGESVDDEKIVIRKCGSLKPCYHGCDAHSNDKIFKPDGNQFCWIKADPTFEGLKQTLYEPEDRVKIQAIQPDIKNDRYVISELQFIDSGNLFGNQKIELNENLNSIIGGKSSGKSLLLFSTAKSIDPEQVDKASKRLNFEGYRFETTFDFKVVWKNGDEDFYSKSDPTQKLHKISYIPQLYINYLVEKNNKEELNQLIKNILLQDSEFKVFYEDTFREISDTNSEIERLINEYFKVRKTALDVQQKSKDTGNSKTIQQAIQNTTELIQKGQQASNLSETEFKEYSELIQTKSTLDAEIRTMSLKGLTLQKVLNEVISNKHNLLGKIDTGVILKGSIDRILDELGDVGADIAKIKELIVSDYDTLIYNLQQNIISLDLVNKKMAIEKQLIQNSEKLRPLLEKLAGQKEIQKLSKQLEDEKQKFQTALALEQQLKNLFEEYNNIRKQTANLLQQRFTLYKRVVDKVNSTKNNIGSDIQLNSSLIYRQENFALNNQVNKAALRSDHYFNGFFVDGALQYPKAIELYEKPLRVNEEKLFSTTDDIIPLKLKITLEDVLRGLAKDSFEIDYTVTYKGDNLLHMSPGKKGTVLLILFLQISSSEFPILIDQPEDNLDNRTIYELLCKMIKEKKKERQILIVSHNANLVVATDTENIIVANQKGQSDGSSGGTYRFEYVNGSLEHTKIKDDRILSILQSQGIREHVCDILEGGDEAFKQREKKYAIKN